MCTVAQLEAVCADTNLDAQALCFFPATVLLRPAWCTSCSPHLLCRPPPPIPSVVNWTYVGVVLVNAVFGAMGYMVFGSNTQGLVIFNVCNNVVGGLVKILLGVDLLFTVPIVLSAPRRLLERALVPAVRVPCHAGLPSPQRAPLSFPPFPVPPSSAR